MTMNNPNPKNGKVRAEQGGESLTKERPLNFVDGEGVRNFLSMSKWLYVCEGCL